MADKTATTDLYYWLKLAEANPENKEQAYDTLRSFGWYRDRAIRFHEETDALIREKVAKHGFDALVPSLLERILDARNQRYVFDRLISVGCTELESAEAAVAFIRKVLILDMTGAESPTSSSVVSNADVIARLTATRRLAQMMIPF